MTCRLSDVRRGLAHGRFEGDDNWNPTSPCGPAFTTEWTELSRRRTRAGLKGLVLVAPAPPTPIAAPKEQRDAVPDSYQSSAGVDIALSILTSRQLSPELRKQVVDDTIGGAPAAKRAWTQEGMTLDISGIVGNINVPTTVIVGDADKVETEPLLRRELASRISGTEFIVLPGVGHLSPLEAPSELAAAITKAISNMR
jgi:pimeloyl-ACP methyl ester carboxylesterase